MFWRHRMMAAAGALAALGLGGCDRPGGWQRHVAAIERCGEADGARMAALGGYIRSALDLDAGQARALEPVLAALADPAARAALCDAETAMALGAAAAARKLAHGLALASAQAERLAPALESFEAGLDEDQRARLARLMAERRRGHRHG
jgi:hypothetical protein